jgi:hypothetical protein
MPAINLRSSTITSTAGIAQKKGIKPIRIYLIKIHPIGYNNKFNELLQSKQFKHRLIFTMLGVRRREKLVAREN